MVKSSILTVLIRGKDEEEGYTEEVDEEEDEVEADEEEGKEEEEGEEEEEEEKELEEEEGIDGEVEYEDEDVVGEGLMEDVDGLTVAKGVGKKGFLVKDARVDTVDWSEDTRVDEVSFTYVSSGVRDAVLEVSSALGVSVVDCLMVSLATLAVSNTALIVSELEDLLDRRLMEGL